MKPTPQTEPGCTARDQRRFCFLGACRGSCRFCHVGRLGRAQSVGRNDRQRITPRTKLALFYFNNFSDEAIPLPNYGLKILWVSRVVPQDGTYLIDCSVDPTFGFKVDVFTPQALNDGLTCNQLPSALYEQNQKLHGDAFKLQGPAATAELVLSRVQLKVTEVGQVLRHRYERVGAARSRVRGRIKKDYILSLPSGRIWDVTVLRLAVACLQVSSRR